MRLPDFIIIGAAKAGTTSLYEVLSTHPAVFMSTPKEPEFFARDDRYAGGIAAYARLFEPAAPGQICGEASTLYSLATLFPETPARIRASVPDVRLVYVLREPVARAYSYYVQLVKNRQNATRVPLVPRRFEECLFPEAHPGRAPRDAFFADFDAHLPDSPELFLAGSDYGRQIKAYLAHFDRSQMHFVLFEQLMADPSAVLRDLFAFLGIDPDLVPEKVGMARSNISEDHFERFGREARLAGIRKRLGPLYLLLQRLPSGVRRVAKEFLARSSRAAGPQAYVPAPMLRETRMFLQDHFAARRDELTMLTRLDLSVWNTKH